MDILIRRALPQDLADAGRITVDAFVGGGFTRPDSPYVALLSDAGRRSLEAELLVAVDASDQRVLGCVTFAVGGTEWADIATPEEGEIRMLATDGAARGRGVGESLVRASIARSRELGLAGMAFSTQPTMTTAHRVYERIGFLRTPGRDWSPIPGMNLMVYTMAF
ncbi:GNAT family N-acetyltransferase [Streptomyces sp. NRRL WC-3742]|uniref:GNAT family N-acetyltransferase n=1 Tax=Streptomyces sp. NRRL WC-3742 TaxID=1463934 RepID=UPI0004CC6AE7|nr:N-acetyltransferase [Streptomyces sp. NRRL WC-3742]